MQSITRHLPKRVSHVYTQTIHAGPEAVFPLLCPVREHDWVSGWTTDWVISSSGVAEEGCVFQTPGEEGMQPAIWVITCRDTAEFRVEMVKTQPGYLVTRLRIELEPCGQACTLATVCYDYTALGAEGAAFVEACTPEWYEAFMQDWEAAMNRYLATATGCRE